jgi:hypothetical protein
VIHECRTALLNRMFDELSRKPGSGAEQLSDQIISTAQAIVFAFSPLTEKDGQKHTEGEREKP